MRDFVAAHELIIANSFNRQTRWERKWTWRSPFDGHMTVKDYVLVRRTERDLIRGPRVTLRNDIHSDHHMMTWWFCCRVGDKREDGESVRRWNVCKVDGKFTQAVRSGRGCGGGVGEDAEGYE